MVAVDTRGQQDKQLNSALHTTSNHYFNGLFIEMFIIIIIVRVHAMFVGTITFKPVMIWVRSDESAMK